MKLQTLSCLSLALVLLLILLSTVYAEVKVPALISDQMVLQQGRKIRLWGTAQPGEKVTVSFAGETATTEAGADSRWQVHLGPYKAGGPYILKITGKNRLTFHNVLVGEVWVCSGQSNMEWPLMKAAHGVAETAQANHPQIRLFTVKRNTAIEPRDDVEGHWSVCSPKTAGEFSAVGYFFGRELHQKIKTPIGLIHTSWGGTPAEAWTSHSALASHPELKAMADSYDKALANLPQAKREYEQKWADWERQNFYQDSGNKGFAMGFAKLNLTGETWQKMELPQYWERTGLDVDGSIWFRKEVDIPKSWAGKDLFLRLGAIDDFDTTYFNEVKVGSTGGETPNYYAHPRKYKIPASIIRPGRNIIAVRVFDHFASGGFGAEPGEMSLSIGDTRGAPAISLDGLWDYKIEQAFAPKKIDFREAPAAPPGTGNSSTPSVLYNGMVAPLVPYTMRGVIWYQGESNVGRAGQYKELFPTMIRDWRRAWGQGDFPFLFVQLANYLKTKPEPGESGWAELREAQLMTLKEPQMAMAVAIDVGEATDIHPRNKKDVGHRLALAALAKVYGQDLEFSGPIYDSFQVEKNKIRLSFKHAESGLMTKNGEEVKGFAIAGADRRFVWAKGKIEKDTVVVWSDEIAHPVAVRYAWADNPVCNLYNGAGLPASPFRTDNSSTSVSKNNQRENELPDASSDPLAIVIKTKISKKSEFFTLRLW